MKESPIATMRKVFSATGPGGLRSRKSARVRGAMGVDMGRNIFQAEHPVAMIQAVKAVVHDDAKPEDAFQLYNDLKG